MKPTQPIIIDSGLPGPIVTIIGGTHGDEVCWVQALDIIRDTLRVKKWRLYLIYGNIEAIEKNTRQIDLNLNRMYRDDSTFTESEKNTIEYKRSREIIPYLEQSDALLDLHSSPSIGSHAFIICEENCRDVIDRFPFETVCYGFTDMEPGGTDGYMNSRSKIGICVECGNHLDATARDKALISIIRFLEYFDMIERGSIETTPAKSIYTATLAYKTKTTSFKVAKKFSDFENITLWQLIGYDSDEAIYSDFDGKILFARDRDQIGVEWFVTIIAS